jgi:hypothetical protein
VWPSALPATILSGFYWLVLAQFTPGGYGSLVIAGLTGCLIYFALFLVIAVSSGERRYGLDALKKITGLLPGPQQNRP